MIDSNNENFSVYGYHKDNVVVTLAHYIVSNILSKIAFF